jgi:sugar lactone lactonase YvrE
LIVDKQTDSLLICDSGNKRIVRWPRQNGANGETIISRVNCDDLAMDKYGYIYVFDHFTQEGKRWKIGDRNGIVVAGRNEKGHRNDQLNYPTSIFVDQDQSVYVSDNHNHRVMQWKKATKEGSVIVGDKFGQGEEQLNYPTGLTFDPQNNLYVVDRHNRRIQKFNISN